MSGDLEDDAAKLGGADGGGGTLAGGDRLDERVTKVKEWSSATSPLNSLQGSTK